MGTKEISELNEQLRRHMFQLADPQFWKRNDEMTDGSIDAFRENGFLRNIRAVYLVGHGTSYATALNGESLIAHIAGVYARAVYAYQMREYPDELIREPQQTLVIGVTCGGNTVSVRKALEEAKKRGAYTMLASNNGNPSCASAADLRVRTDCGIEERAEVQAYSISHLILLSALYKVGILLAERNGTADKEKAAQWKRKLERVKEQMTFIPEMFQKMESIARWYREAGFEHMVVLGTGPNQGTMREGALKICEMAWKFDAGEELEDFAHGRFRELDGSIPLFIISPSRKTQDKVLDLLTGCYISQTPSVVFAGEKTEVMEKLATHIVEMPEVEDEYLTPFLYVIPLWFLGYHLRQMEGGLVGEKRFGLFAKDIDFHAHFNPEGEWIG